MLFHRSTLSEQLIHKFAELALTEVASRSLMAALVCSALETAGWITWGHETLLVAVVPILAWAGARTWADRE